MQKFVKSTTFFQNIVYECLILIENVSKIFGYSGIIRIFAA